jgi:hypothetical protein
MPYFLLVVEGAHDAAFLGSLLQRRGHRKVQLRSEVDSYWEKLIPTTFPANPKGRLDHVVRYPDIYESPDKNDTRSVAIMVAGGDSQLVREFQDALDILDIPQLRAAAIVSDANGIGVATRVAQIVAGLEHISDEGAKNLVPGFPLVLPRAPGFVEGNPRIGIHVFPDNVNAGTLETVLLECSVTSYSRYTQPAIDFVNSIDESCPPALAELQALRSGSGRHKAAAGIIGNLLFPGSALSVSIDRGSWLDPVTNAEIGLVSVRGFLDSLLL